MASTASQMENRTPRSGGRVHSPTNHNNLYLPPSAQSALTRLVSCVHQAHRLVQDVLSRHPHCSDTHYSYSEHQQPAQPQVPQRTFPVTHHGNPNHAGTQGNNHYYKSSPISNGTSTALVTRAHATGGNPKRGVSVIKSSHKPTHIGVPIAKGPTHVASSSHTQKQHSNSPYPGNVPGHRILSPKPIPPTVHSITPTATAKPARRAPNNTATHNLALPSPAPVFGMEASPEPQRIVLPARTKGTAGMRAPETKGWLQSVNERAGGVPGTGVVHPISIPMLNLQAVVQSREGRVKPTMPIDDVPTMLVYNTVASTSHQRESSIESVVVLDLNQPIPLTDTEMLS